MRRLDLLAVNYSFLYGNVTEHQLECPILCSFLRFSEPLVWEQTPLVIVDSFNTHLSLLEIRKNQQLSCLKKDIFVFSLRNLVPLKAKSNVYGPQFAYHQFYLALIPPDLEVMISIVVTERLVHREATVRRSRAGKAVKDSKGKCIPMENKTLHTCGE